CSTVGITALRHVQPNKVCWKQSPSTVQLNQLNYALMKTRPSSEFLASVGNTVLTRKDFLALGRLRSVEATILNACLSVLKDIADLQDIPRQQNSNNCGVFVLMYALYIVMEGRFDFNESDMLTIRRWWCMFLLSNYPLKSDTERKELERAEVMETPLPDDYLTKMPPDILWRILMRVVTDDGDVAFWRLSMTCKVFRDIVNKHKFREEAHFEWLDI
ncbi:hypothetical protein F2P79_018383, partial [Pimephales promelas]